MWITGRKGVPYGILSVSGYPTYNKKLTTNRPKLPAIIPRMPTLLLCAIMPSEIENIKINKKNQREFHHLASFAGKQITNHSKPATANIKLTRP